MSIDKLQEIDEVLKQEIAQRHSYFQLKYFVIGKEVTNQSKMWQCLRELKSRKESLNSIQLEIEESKDNIELLNIAIEKLEKFKTKSDLKEREKEIRLRQLNRKKTAAELNSVQLEERKIWIFQEAIFFLETFKTLQKIEPLKNFDDLEVQKEYWSQKLTNKLNLKMLTNNQLDIEMIETIIALPDDLPIKQQTLNTLSIRQQSMLQQLKDSVKLAENKEI